MITHINQFDCNTLLQAIFPIRAWCSVLHSERILFLYSLITIFSAMAMHKKVFKHSSIPQRQNIQLRCSTRRTRITVPQAATVFTTLFHFPENHRRTVPHRLYDASDAHLTGYFAQTKNGCMYIKPNPLNIMHEHIITIQGLKTTVDHL